MRIKAHIQKLTEQEAFGKDESLNPAGTSYQAMLNISYQDLVDKFGEPTMMNGDDYKTDREWIFKTPSGIVTIYNWKDGPNFAREEGGAGMPVKDIREWHIGAKERAFADEFLKLTELDHKQEAA